MSEKIALPDTEASFEALEPILAAQGYAIAKQGVLKDAPTMEELVQKHRVSLMHLQEQLEIGIKEEMEHTWDMSVAKTIAMQHLDEDPYYYSNLKKTMMDVEGKKLQDYYETGGILYSCETLDKNGERAIDPESIRRLTECLETLPQTKVMHYDMERNQYQPYRTELHKDIINHFKKDLVCIERDQPIAILMGGSPASGKSTFLKKYAPYLLKEEILRVDADEVRAMLPEYKGYNAAQTHLETKDIVNTLLSDRTIGVPCRFDVIYDGTMNSTKSYLPLINLLKAQGYKIFIVYIDRVPKDVVIKRALERYKKSGRFVPLEVIEDFFSKGKEALEALKREVDGYMIIDGSTQDYSILEQGGMELPKDRNYSNIGRPIQVTSEEVIQEFKSGGYLKGNDGQAHNQGDKGGYLEGASHDDGGIPAIVKPTKQPIEMEGGEVVITKKAVSDPRKREFNGKMMTNREILSAINQSGGGVAFEDGGEVPHKCACSGKEYAFGGNVMKDFDIVNNLLSESEQYFAGVEDFDLPYSERMKKLYAAGGSLDDGMLQLMNKKIPSFKKYAEENKHIHQSMIRQSFKEHLKKEHDLIYDELPLRVQAAVMIGSQTLIDNYLNG